MLNIALYQTKVYFDKNETLKHVEAAIIEASDKGARIIALPEMFNCPYSGKNFPVYAEEEGSSETIKLLKKLCMDRNIYIIGGSIPEKWNDNIYNTCYVIDPKGDIIAKHRKIHLFDVDIENGTKFFESRYLSSGDSVTVFDTEFGRLGVCICYDIRFPELIRRMVMEGAELIFIPAAFGMTTGPAHWELLFRMRAVDNQVYVAGISPSRDCEGNYKPFGHSIIVNPWGEIISTAGETEEIIYGEIDFEQIKKIRREMPLLMHRRPELY